MKTDIINPEKTILVFDPGESTGWVYGSSEQGLVAGGTARKNHVEVAKLIQDFQPDLVVFERFNLYPSMAKSLSWNSFYPCEVIGVIRYTCDVMNIPYVEQAPSIKKYAGGFGNDWEQFKQCFKVTEHTKDAYLHWKYYLRNHK